MPEDDEGWGTCSLWDGENGSPEAPASSIFISKTSTPPWMPVVAVVPITLRALSSKGVRVGAVLAPAPVLTSSSRRVDAFFYARLEKSCHFLRTSAPDLGTLITAVIFSAIWSHVLSFFWLFNDPLNQSNKTV